MTDTPEIDSDDMVEFLQDFINAAVEREGKTKVTASIEDELYPAYLIWKKEKDNRRHH